MTLLAEHALGFRGGEGGGRVQLSRVVSIPATDALNYDLFLNCLIGWASNNRGLRIHPGTRCHRPAPFSNRGRSSHQSMSLWWRTNKHRKQPIIRSSDETGLTRKSFWKAVVLHFWSHKPCDDFQHVFLCMYEHGNNPGRTVAFVKIDFIVSADVTEKSVTAQGAMSSMTLCIWNFDSEKNTTVASKSFPKHKIWCLYSDLWGNSLWEYFSSIPLTFVWIHILSNRTLSESSEYSTLLPIYGEPSTGKKNGTTIKLWSNQSDLWLNLYLMYCTCT